MGNIEDLASPAASIARAGALRFGARVRELRTARGWTQAQLSDMLSRSGRPWHQTTVTKLESGVRPTTVEEAFALALTLGVAVDDLFRDDEGDALIHAELARDAGRLHEIAAQMKALDHERAQLSEDFRATAARFTARKATLPPAARAAFDPPTNEDEMP